MFFITYFFILFSCEIEFSGYSGGHFNYEHWLSKIKFCLIMVSVILLCTSFIKIYSYPLLIKKEFIVSFLGILIFTTLSYIYMYFVAVSKIYILEGYFSYIAFIGIQLLGVILSIITFLKTKNKAIKLEYKRNFRLLLYSIYSYIVIFILTEIIIYLYFNYQNGVLVLIDYSVYMRNYVIPYFPNTKILYLNWCFDGIIWLLIISSIISYIKYILNKPKWDRYNRMKKFKENYPAQLSKLK